LYHGTQARNPLFMYFWVFGSKRVERKSFSIFATLPVGRPSTDTRSFGDSSLADDKTNHNEDDRHGGSNHA
jgi:hypothetical protein